MGHALILPVEAERNEIYRAVIPQIKSLIEDESDLIANLSNISAALYQALDVLWVGFYLRKGNDLVLGPFQGPIACTRIQVEPSEKGVCGAAAVQKETIIVPDVEAFPGHIACSSKSKSEIVVPLVVNGRTTLVLDIDSESYDDFSLDDKIALEQIVSEIGRIHFNS